jgi:hypothetical protein
VLYIDATQGEQQMEATPDLAVYVLARTDLPSMNPGKLAAQVHHAGVQMMSLFADHPLVQQYVAEGVAQGAYYFNTTIVLGATMDQLHGLRCTYGWEYHLTVKGSVVDPSYPFFVENQEVADLVAANGKAAVIKTMDDGRVLMTRQETTCIWCLVDRNRPEVADILGHLKLYP